MPRFQPTDSRSASLAPAGAHRQLARSVVALFVAASLVALAGPVLGYRSDLKEIELLLHRRVEREADLFASLLGARLEQMQAELSRLATRPEVDPRDGPQTIELDFLNFAHEDSVQFRQGVAVFDLRGEAIWSKPPGLLEQEFDLRRRDWMLNVLAGYATIDAFTNDARFVVAVPLLRGGMVAGAVVGLIDAEATGLPTASSLDGLDLVVVDETGDVLLPNDLPGYALTKGFLPEVERLLRHPRGAPLDASGPPRFAVARTVGRTGLRVVVAADEALATGAARHRFLMQMMTIAALQMLAVALLALLFRMVTRRFVATERAALDIERLVALGTASSLIAHEVKNALNGLSAATSLLATEADSALGVRSLRGEIARLAHLSNSLLQFSRPGSARRHSVDLVLVANEAVEAVSVLPERDEVELVLDFPDTLDVSCDPMLVLSAVQNLLRNAIEATVAAKDSGRLTHPKVTLRVENKPDAAWIVVEDNAGKMPDEVRERLFQPFASSKAKGVGLGLVMARRAIEAHGGVLRYESLPDGSRFCAQLPTSVSPDPEPLS